MAVASVAEMDTASAPTITAHNIKRRPLGGADHLDLPSSRGNEHASTPRMPRTRSRVQKSPPKNAGERPKAKVQRPKSQAAGRALPVEHPTPRPKPPGASPALSTKASCHPMRQEPCDLPAPLLYTQIGKLQQDAPLDLSNSESTIFFRVSRA
jgi:hypothetical protein